MRLCRVCVFISVQEERIQNSTLLYFVTSNLASVCKTFGKTKLFNKNTVLQQRMESNYSLMMTKPVLSKDWQQKKLNFVFL